MMQTAVLAAMLASAATAGAEWPQFRGPDGQGHSTATNLPTTWSEDENVAWKTPIPGRGWSSPIVNGAQVWFTTAIDEGKSLRAVCVDRASGGITHNIEVFHVESPPPINAKNSYASPTPVTEGDRVYVNFGTAGTACLNTNTGKILWKNEELKLDHKEGAGSSPILWHDFLVINCDGTDVQFVAALDKQTGHIAWKKARPGPMPENTDFRKAYSTPLVIHEQGRDQLISTGAHQVLAYDPASGDELWRIRYDGFSNVPRPVSANHRVYICTGYMRPQLWAINLGSGEVTDRDVAWRFTRQVPSNPSPLLVGDQLYMVSDQGVATCLDAATGKELWKERLGGNYSASPILADGKIYVASEEGNVTVFKPGDVFQRVAINQLQGRIMASLAPVGQAIYVRSDSHLYRLENTKLRQARRPIK